ncbi:hypothetical protein Psta_2051 [Pirellula staleyi DSM 6068]|uniref:Uncharacterized protein n=1 Tax=Pirellula staleyi (strain ATCC 27377 / DSM 6068 / ICPB 4128) TaxID=530564 RepID=D2R1K6_PIRSD|nr:hypothetical protein Psta_2051 [Pirellula staleyi DSM 6068]
MLHLGRFGSCLPIFHAHLRLAWLAHVPHVFGRCKPFFGALYPTQNNFMAHFERIALAFLIPAATLLVIGT